MMYVAETLAALMLKLTWVRQIKLSQLTGNVTKSSKPHLLNVITLIYLQLIEMLYLLSIHSHH